MDHLSVVQVLPLPVALTCNKLHGNIITEVTFKSYLGHLSRIGHNTSRKRRAPPTTSATYTDSSDRGLASAQRQTMQTGTVRGPRLPGLQC